MSSYYSKNRAKVLAKYRENFIVLIEKQLTAYYANRLERIEYQKQYHLENHDKFLNYQKNYYEKNKQRLLEDRSQKVLCSCNKLILKGNLSQHIKTNLHLKLVEILNKNKNKINPKIDFIIEKDDGTIEKYIDDKVEKQFIKKQSYYQENKEKIKEKLKATEFMCICGKNINKGTELNHYKTKHHKNFVAEMNAC